jgi:hypothetical protein
MSARILGIATAFVAALSVHWASSRPFELRAGERSYRRLVAGATPSGRVPESAVLSFPGIRRSSRGEVLLEVEGGALRLSIDNGRPVDVRPNAEGAVLMELPPTGSRGARLHLAPLAPSLVLRSVAVRGSPPPLWAPALAFLATLVASIAIGRAGDRRLGLSCGLAVAALSVLAAGSFLLASFFLAASAAVGLRARAYGSSTLLLAALFFGAWVRFFFLFSAGSWDTEYWKAWMARAVDAGVARVYGDSDATPRGGFVSHLLGKARLFQIEYKGRDFVVDYPPLAMALWRWSWAAVTWVAPGLEGGEAENVAVKLPAVLGDVLSALLLYFLFRSRRGMVLAALYWALPLSWLPSAVLGFLDAAYAPFAVLGLVAACQSRAALSGALVALAALIKPQALLVAPAALAALDWGRARAVAAGLSIVGLALVPFALAGTLEEAVTHVFRILFQQRLSAGFANLWWVLGHFAAGASAGARVEYASIDSLAFPAPLVGTALFLAASAWVLARAGKTGPLAGAGLVFSYGTLAMGVHENHVHAMFLAFAATGLFSRRLRIVVAVLSLSYLLNMLALSGLGRFYGLRYMTLEPWAAWISSLRMGLGFDVTFPLGILNTLLFVLFLASLAREVASQSPFLYPSPGKCA